MDGKLIPKENKIMGGLAYPDSKKIPKSKSKKKYHIRSKSSKFSVKTRSTNNTDYPNSNIDANLNYNLNYNYNNKLKGNIQNNFKNSEILSTNFDSKEINNQLLKKNNNLFVSHEMSKNFENMKNKLDNVTEIMQNMNQKINFLETKIKDLYNFPKNDFHNNQTNEYNKIDNMEMNKMNIENKNEEDYANKEALKEAMDYYQNSIQKNGNNNDNPVEIFEDVNNHVEDIRQEVLNNKTQNINGNEEVGIYNQGNNNINDINTNTSHF